MMFAVGLVICLALVGGALIAGTWRPPADATIAFELRKYLIQFLLIVALGAVVAFLVDDAKRRADKAEEARRTAHEAADRRRQSAIDTATSLLARLDEIYAEVKQARRALRRAPASGLTQEAYIDVIVGLTDGEKAELDKLWREMKDLQDLIPELEHVWPVVRRMEDYLRRMEDEMESVVDEQPSGFDAASLEQLQGFRAKAADGVSTFGGFRNLYHEARNGLVVLIASRRSGAATDPV